MLNERTQNQPNYDRQNIHFGFSLGLANYYFKVNEKPMRAGTDSVYTFDVVPGKGYAIGIVSDLRLTKRLNLRFIPSLSYVQRGLDYQMYRPSQDTTIVVSRTVESTFIDFPFTLKFKSDRYGNGRAYVLAGGKFSLDLASQQKVEEPDLFKLRGSDFYWELGIGGDFYFEYFKFSPELKIAFGNRNMLVDDNPQFTGNIESLLSRSVVFSLNFE